MMIIYLQSTFRTFHIFHRSSLAPWLCYGELAEIGELNPSFLAFANKMPHHSVGLHKSKRHAFPQLLVSR
jgi:hypothetical protein